MKAIELHHSRAIPVEEIRSEIPELVQGEAEFGIGVTKGLQKGIWALGLEGSGVAKGLENGGVERRKM